LRIKFVNGLAGYPNFVEFKIKWVTPYPFLLFVSNVQSMKVNTKP